MAAAAQRIRHFRARRLPRRARSRAAGGTAFWLVSRLLALLCLLAVCLAFREVFFPAPKTGSASGAAPSSTPPASDMPVSGTPGPGTPDSGTPSACASLAQSLLGLPYAAGGATPEGFDCSGLTAYVYARAADITLPHSAFAQYTLGAAVARASLEPGDLVFFATEGGKTVTHCGVFVGNGKFVAADSGTQNRVSLETLGSAFWSPLYVGARRLLPAGISGNTPG